MIVGRAFQIIVVILFWANISYAQKFNIKTYSVNEGLPSGNVYDVHTDESGFLWFGTSSGLVRFDGKEFITFDIDDGLKDAMIYNFHFEGDGEKWIATEFGGVAKYDGISFEYVPELAVLDTMVINYVTGNTENEIWFGTDLHGVAIWDQLTNEILFINEEDGLPANQIWDIDFFSDNEIWITTMFGIGVYDRDLGVMKTYIADERYSGEQMYETAEDLKGRYWVATENGVTIIQPDGAIQTITEVDGETLDYVYSIEVDLEGTVWIGTERRGLVLIKEDGSNTRIKRQNGLSSNFIYRIIRDDDGTMWVATDGNGVNVFKDYNFLRYDKESELNANDVFAIKQVSDGSMWISTENGISNLKAGVFQHYTIPESLIDYADEIWDIEELPNGDLLLLTYTYEFLQFDGREFSYPRFREEFSGVFLNDLFIDKDGSIWFSAYGQLFHYQNGQFSHYYPPEAQYWQSALGKIYRDNFENLWITTEGGLARFNEGEFEYYSEIDGIPGHTIHEIVEDKFSNIWIGTNNGIAYLEAEDIKSNNIVFKEFLAEDLITKETVFLLFDTMGNLWQGTNAGLNYFEMINWDYEKAPRQVHFPLSNNGNSIEFNGAARTVDADGRLWFGSYSNGLVSFEYSENDSTISETTPPEIFLRSVRADIDEVYNQQMKRAALEDVKIEHSSNDVTLSFNAIDYVNPRDITIQYRLLGYDENWTSRNDINEVRYTNLPPGQYTFQITGKSARSDWGEAKDLISFSILKPFYLTVPFYISLLLMFGLFIFMYINSRIGKLERKELQKLVDQQTSDLTSALAEKEVLIKEIHHRVKNNLAVVSGLLELQGFRMPAGSAKMAIQQSKMRVIAMSKIHENLYQNEDLANVDFRKFINELLKSIQATMDITDKDIEVVQYVEEVLLDVNIGVPLGLITNEIVSNSYKHAFAGKKHGTITIKFSDVDEDDNYQLIISDDGMGAPPDLLRLKSKSLGLTLIKSLTAQISGKMEFSNSVGSTFKLTIPKDQGKKAIIY